jgi:hypothetical protein
MFPIYSAKCLLHKAVHNWVKKFSQGRLKVADDGRPGVEVAETKVKRLKCCGFRHSGKDMGQEYQCLWRICREINAFSRFEYLMFYVDLEVNTEETKYMLMPDHQTAGKKS